MQDDREKASALAVKLIRRLRDMAAEETSDNRQSFECRLMTGTELLEEAATVGTPHARVLAGVHIQFSRDDLTPPWDARQPRRDGLIRFLMLPAGEITARVKARSEGSVSLADDTATEDETIAVAVKSVRDTMRLPPLRRKEPS